jgi:hypothetical protein
MIARKRNNYRGAAVSSVPFYSFRLRYSALAGNQIPPSESAICCRWALTFLYQYRPLSLVSFRTATGTVAEAVAIVKRFATDSCVKILAGPFLGRVGRVISSSGRATRVKFSAFGREIALTAKNEDLTEAKCQDA